MSIWRAGATEGVAREDRLLGFCWHLKPGCICFDGPSGHVGYFRDDFVLRRRWLDETSCADLVALCQFYRDRRAAKLGFPSA